MRARALVRGRRAWIAAFSTLAALSALLAAGAASEGSTATPVAASVPAPPPPPAIEDAAPARSAPPAAAAAAAAAPAPAPPAASTEENLMERLRAAVDGEPTLALAIADQGDAAFPSGPLAEERSYLRMRALVHLGDIGKARTVAGEFFERHPESPYGRFVYRLTGMRPRRLGPPS
jgi:hypothetical protein